MKNTKQENLIEKYEKLKEAIDKPLKATITKIEYMTNKEFYGEEACSVYDERQGIAMTLKIKEQETEFKVFYNIPIDIRGIGQSNIHAFEKKYGSVPKENMEVDTVLNENGFFDIVI